MKIFVLLIFGFATQSLASLEIQITNLKSKDGKVILSIYKDALAFPSDGKKAQYTTQASIQNQEMVTIKIPDLEQGVYAVALFHDENVNEKLDTNFLGIPREGYGFSQDAKVRLGPPNFEEAKFRFDDQNKKIKIKMRYW